MFKALNHIVLIHLRAKAVDKAVKRHKELLSIIPKVTRKCVCVCVYY